jgi:hypothetical protein
MPRLTGGGVQAEGEGQAGTGAAAGPEGAPTAAATCTNPFGGLEVDEELFGWAAAVAMSRCFGLSR